MMVESLGRIDGELSMRYVTEQETIEGRMKNNVFVDKEAVGESFPLMISLQSSV